MKTLTTLLLFTTLFSVGAYAGDYLLSEKALSAILGNYPSPGSAEEQRDDAILLEYQRTRTQSECEFAASQSKLHVEDVFVKPTGPLTSEEIQKVHFRLLKFQATVGLNAYHAKLMYNRPRPYQRNPEIRPCIPLENTSSFPSGHATMGRAVGKFFAELYPEKAKELMEVGDQIGTNRLIGGVHHPSDVEAGRKLGDVLADAILHEDLADEETVTSSK